MTKKIVCGTAVACALALAPTAALGTGTPQLPAGAQDRAGMVTPPSASGGNKTVIERQLDAYVEAKIAPAIAEHQRDNESRATSTKRTRTLQIHGSSHLTGYKSRAWSCSSIYTQFDDTISHPFIETSATVDGWSKTVWLGSCPFNANNVTLSDEICFDTFTFSVSFSGGGFSASGGGCGTWSGSVANNWRITHYYTGVKGSGGLLNPIYRVRQSSGGTFRFGTTFVTVVASGSKLI